jgi:hypothetical protein
VGTIWIKEFTGGLDTRRMPETTSGGVLIRAKDGHITRGGEFEKRAAFVPTYLLPAGATKGIAADRIGIYVFGSGATPAGIPTGVTYQRLQSVSGSALLNVPSFDLFSGSIYAAAEFADGGRDHFYNGVRVADWFDGRAGTSFQIYGGSFNAATTAEGIVAITGGTAGAGNQITSITVAGVAIIGAPVAHTGDNVTTAAAIAGAINSYTSIPEYTATSSGGSVFIHPTVSGAAPNGRVVTVVVGGNVTGGAANLANGSDASTSQVTSLTVNGVNIISSPALWTGTVEGTAAAVASAINSTTTAPEYTAVANGSTVTLRAETAGPGSNGFPVVVNAQFGLSNSTPAALSGGAETAGTFTPGAFVKTIGSKEYSTSGPNMHFSGVGAPTKWQTNTVGAGFIDMSSQASGSETLTALSKYQNYVAVFAERLTQIWYVDPDPALNKQVQVLNNTGTASPLSVAQFGDSDIFYLDESGVRSLRARDSSNAAATSDIGVPVDTVITEKLRSLTALERAKIIGLIEPVDGRFWLIMKDVIYVFSFFSGAKVSAWTTYEPGFVVDAAVVFRRRVYLRSGDTIYVYGGLGDTVYDGTVAEAWLPYLDAGSPTKLKHLTGIDAAVRGNWEVGLALDPVNEDAVDVVANIYKTTFKYERIPAEGASTHISLRFQSTGTGAAKLGSAVVHFEGDADED